MTAAAGLPSVADQASILRSLDRETKALLDRVLEVFLEIDLQGQPVLEGLTGGHVLTHLSREADRMVDELLAATGRVIPPFDAERQWAVERGGDRPGAVLIDDLTESAERLSDALAGVSDWSSLSEAVRAIPGQRLVQIIVHHADLGRPWASVPEEDALVAVAQLPRVMANQLAGIELGDGDPRVLLAWASGRTAGIDEMDPNLHVVSRRIWF